MNAAQASKRKIAQADPTTLSGKADTAWVTERNHLPSRCAGVVATACTQGKPGGGPANAAAVEALADPAVRSPLIGLEFEIFPREQQTPEALGALVKADAEKWWPVIRELGIRAE